MYQRKEPLTEQILHIVRAKEGISASVIAKSCGVSRQAIHRHLRRLVREGTLLRIGKTRQARYHAVTTKGIRAQFGPATRFTRRYPTLGLAEDRVLADLRLEWSAYRQFSEPARRIFNYALSEMVNNAIEHSGAPYVEVRAQFHGTTVQFDVVDRGIGIYQKLMERFGLASPLDAIQELLKGKATTDPARHSGEGIFFTSRAADYFAVASERKQLCVDNRRADVYVTDIHRRRGTLVHFELAYDTAKSLEAIFAQHTGEELGFEKTSVRVKLFQDGAPYVSRSEARRLLARCEQFREALLDFSGVATIGQAFADEIFRVFQSVHPTIRIQAINANENVAFMMARARGRDRVTS